MFFGGFEICEIFGVKGFRRLYYRYFYRIFLVKLGIIFEFYLISFKFRFEYWCYFILVKCKLRVMFGCRSGFSNWVVFGFK